MLLSIARSVTMRLRLRTISAERFPDVNLRIVDLETTDEEIPERVFATPTYLLNGRVWSLGNPSPAQVVETFGNVTQ